MGLYDRDYTQADFRPRHRYGPQMRFSFPRLTPAVKWLLIINIAAFVVTFLIEPLARFCFHWFSVFPAKGMSWQLWRLITYQFLHDTAGFGHILINMLWLFFLGPLLERTWGSKKFLIFYLVCGATGGVLYPLLVYIRWLPVAPLVGASGAILGVIAAVTILFPRLRVYVLGIFPVPLVVLTTIFAFISIVTLLRPNEFSNAGGQAAHLAGMATGAIYVFSKSWQAKFKSKIQSARWRSKIAARRNLQVEVDRILQKVHESGIHSLTTKEKRILKQATRSQQMQNKL